MSPKTLLKNWAVAVNVKQGYIDFDNFTTSKPMGLTEEKRKMYLAIYNSQVKRLEDYMNTNQFVDSWHKERAYRRTWSRLHHEIILLAYKNGDIEEI
jgi:hypothetical protein